MNRLFDPEFVPMRVTINKLKFIPRWIVSVDVSVFWNGGDLNTSDVSLMFFDSVLHRSCSLTNVIFTTFTGKPVNHTILFS